jgi:hypothetical protein
MAENPLIEQDIDEYNKSIKDLNAATTNFNKINNNINNNRKRVLQSWEDAEKAFADKHMPHYK